MGDVSRTIPAIAARPIASARLSVPTLAPPGHCWWCGDETPPPGARDALRAGRPCCARCARALDVPGLYLG
jgi:hypothetical protein